MGRCGEDGKGIWLPVDVEAYRYVCDASLECGQGGVGRLLRELHVAEPFGDFFL